MKLRHAAAFALVGWYLLVPSPEMARLRQAEPLSSRWYHVGVYDSKDACADMIATKLAQQTDESERWRYSKAICVDSGDPRMKTK